MLLIHPAAAADYQAAHAAPPVEPPTSGTRGTGSSAGRSLFPPTATDSPGSTTTSSAPRATAFYGSIEISPSTAKMRLVQVAEEIISVLAGDPNAALNISLEIQAEFPSGASDQIKRTVSENASSLGFKSKTWE